MVPRTARRRRPHRAEIRRARRRRHFVALAVAVVVVLIRGLVNMMRGGSGNTSNKLMQMRVLLQFIALVLILLAVYFNRG